MKNRLAFIVIAVCAIARCGLVFSEPVVKSFKTAADYESDIPIKVIQKIALPQGYHEGLLLQGDAMWVNNGKGGKTWVIDIRTGKKVSEIDPAGTFTEGITPAPEGRYWVTDWDTQGLYLARVEDARMVPERRIRLGRVKPTGVVWAGSHLYVIIWKTGLDLRYRLLKMDGEGNIVERVKISGISQPSQIAWDGEYLWITSWRDNHVYKVDPETYHIKGRFDSRIEKVTGIACDGKYLWLTGTAADLYKVELISMQE